MAGSVTGEPTHLALERYLLLLWSPSPRLRFDAEATPFLAGATLHLPPMAPCLDPADAWAWVRAAAAHGAAHRAYSPLRFEAEGLPPITRALLGLLEDARVEAIACRELPGLRGLWARWHVATPDDGDGFEALLLRLARRLLGGAPDPHPWVEKGRHLLFGDAERVTLPVLQAEDLRAAASRLGHDVGQMRLGFNPRLYVPGPSYRDDHRWMWPSAADPVPTAAPAGPEPRASGEPRQAGESTVLALSAEHRYPEWDRAIGRHRQAWCSVREVEPAFCDTPAAAEDAAASPAADTGALKAALRRALRSGWGVPATRLQSAVDGDHFDLDALIRVAVARRTRGEPDARIHQRPQRQRRDGKAALLIDQSRSSADPWGASGLSRLIAAGTIAGLLADALQRVGIESAIAGFSSNGRHDVRFQRVRDFGASRNSDVSARLAGLRSSGSTRVGAAIRHAAACLEQSRATVPRDIVLITDGEPHDIDVHDPHYLLEDARDAVRQANRRGIRVSCIVLDPLHAARARCIVGPSRAALLSTLDGLAPVVRRLASTA